MADKLRWGFLGTARIADRLARAVRASGNGELTAVASRDIARARQWAAKYDVPVAYGSYASLIESDKVDAIYNPLPNSMHLEWTVRAARAGKNILCEKPLAMNATEAAQMIEAAAQGGVLLMEAFMYRFHPQYHKLEEILARGKIGQVRIVQSAFGHNLDRPEDFRWVRELGGGALLDVGCYAVNVSRLVVGSDPIAAQAAGRWTDRETVARSNDLFEKPDAGSVDAAIVGLLEFQGGTLAQIEASFRTSYHQTLVIIGTEGMITVREPFVNGDQPLELEVSAGESRNVVRVPGADKYALMVRAFAEAALRGGRAPYPAEDSLKQMRALDALDVAARRGCRIET